MVKIIFLLLPFLKIYEREKRSGKNDERVYKINFKGGNLKMISSRYDLWSKEEYSYKTKGNFMPNIVSYIHDEDCEIRAAMIIVPGGDMQ